MNRPTKTYTIIVGAGGAGKTSLLGALRAVRNDLGIIMDGDLEPGQNVSKRISDCLDRGLSFTLGTASSGYEIAQAVQRAYTDGYLMRLYYIGLGSVDEHLKRVRKRAAKGGKDVPEAEAMHQFEHRFDALAKILPYCYEGILFDNDNGFVEVAEYKNGEIIPKGASRPMWLQELMEKMGDWVGMGNGLVKIDEIKKTVLDIAPQYHISSAKLLGAYAGGDETPNSDIDVMIETERPFSLFDLIGFQQDLEDRLNKKIHVITNSVPADSGFVLGKAINLYKKRDSNLFENVRNDLNEQNVSTMNHLPVDMIPFIL